MVEARVVAHQSAKKGVNRRKVFVALTQRLPSRSKVCKGEYRDPYLSSSLQDREQGTEKICETKPENKLQKAKFIIR